MTGWSHHETNSLRESEASEMSEEKPEPWDSGRTVAPDPSWPIQKQLHWYKVCSHILLLNCTERTRQAAAAEADRETAAAAAVQPEARYPGAILLAPNALADIVKMCASNSPAISLRDIRARALAGLGLLDAPQPHAAGSPADGQDCQASHCPPSMHTGCEWPKCAAPEPQAAPAP